MYRPHSGVRCFCVPTGELRSVQKNEVFKPPLAARRPLATVESKWSSRGCECVRASKETNASLLLMSRSAVLYHRYKLRASLR